MSAPARPLPQILLVDDDNDCCVLTERLLTNAAVTNPVVRARDAAEARGRLETAAKTGALPGLMILDVNLPGASGFDLLKWVRREPALRALKVVIWTTSSELSGYLMSRELGAEALLIKYSERLAAVARDCLASGSGAARAVFAAAEPAAESRREVLQRRIADYRRVIASLEEQRATIVARRPYATDRVLVVLQDRMGVIDRTVACLRRSLAAAEQELGGP